MQNKEHLKKVKKFELKDRRLGLAIFFMGNSIPWKTHR